MLGADRESGSNHTQRNRGETIHANILRLISFSGTGNCPSASQAPLGKFSPNARKGSRRQEPAA